tara:strand:+ start:1468 stop:1668 length:201 start_codon:yes stop_codon:yes gene_type:complete
MSYKAEVDVEVIRTTELALLVTEGETEEWVPKSVLDDEGDINDASSVGDEGTMILPQKMAEEKGFV